VIDAFFGNTLVFVWLSCYSASNIQHYFQHYFQHNTVAVYFRAFRIFKLHIVYGFPLWIASHCICFIDVFPSLNWYDVSFILLLSPGRLIDRLFCCWFSRFFVLQFYVSIRLVDRTHTLFFTRSSSFFFYVYMWSNWYTFFGTSCVFMVSDISFPVCVQHLDGSIKTSVFPGIITSLSFLSPLVTCLQSFRYWCRKSGRTFVRFHRSNLWANPVN